MITRRHWAYLLPVMTLVLVSLGCTTDSGELGSTTLAVPLGAQDQPARDSGEVVGPDGGVVVSGDVVVEVPAGALSKATWIGIHRGVDGSVDLIPDGQRFRVPVQLHLAVPSGRTAAACVIQWFDPSISTWVTIPSEARGNGRVASLQHFSLYRTVDMVE